MQIQNILDKLVYLETSEEKGYYIVYNLDNKKYLIEEVKGNIIIPCNEIYKDKDEVKKVVELLNQYSVPYNKFEEYYIENIVTYRTRNKHLAVLMQETLPMLLNIGDKVISKSRLCLGKVISIKKEHINILGCGNYILPVYKVEFKKDDIQEYLSYGINFDGNYDIIKEVSCE